jgi:hypothetical protein
MTGNPKSKIENPKLKWFRRTFWRERIGSSDEFWICDFGFWIKEKDKCVRERRFNFQNRIPAI